MFHDEDAQLMLSYQTGRDPAALTQLFQRNAPALVRFLARLCGDRDLAEDLAQQTWLKLLGVAQRHAYAPRVGVTFRTWLFTLARNGYIDERRRQSLSRRTAAASEFESDEACEADCADAAQPLHAIERAALLRAALECLPSEQRDAVALWSSDMKVEAIAALMRAPRETILSRKKYGLAKLRANLVARGVSYESA